MYAVTYIVEIYSHWGKFFCAALVARANVQEGKLHFHVKYIQDLYMSYVLFFKCCSRNNER